MSVPLPLVDARLIDGCRRFDHGDFWNAHEVWEALWRDSHGAARELLKGLIQCAAVAHLLRRQRLGGVAALCQRASGYLAHGDLPADAATRHRWPISSHRLIELRLWLDEVQRWMATGSTAAHAAPAPPRLGLESAPLRH